MRYRYRSDDELKDSGVEWIGKIPKDWEVSKLRWYLRCKSGDFITNITNKENMFIEDAMIPVIGGNGIMGYGKEFNVKENVLAIGRVGALCGNVHFIDYPCWITDNSLIVNSINDKLEIKYLFRLLQALNLNRLSTSTAQPLITGETIKRSSLCIPSLCEQQYIYKFIDEKISQFDLIISKKEELIKKLEEAKKSLISEVVTGKVKVVKTDGGYELVKRKSDEMKDSGVEWLGNIPNEWHLEKGKWLFYNSNEKGDESKILLSATQDRGIIPKEQLDSVVQNKEDTDFTNFKLVKKYDFIISLRSFQGGFEMSEYDEGIITPAYSVLRSKTELNPYYYKYLLKERGFIGILNSLTVGIRDGKNIKYDDFAKTLLPKPSLKEQQIISDYINISILNINSTISKTKKQIEKLKEAKQSLISEAVTGKIEILD